MKADEDLSEQQANIVKYQLEVKEAWRAKSAGEELTEEQQQIIAPLEAVHKEQREAWRAMSADEELTDKQEKAAAGVLAMHASRIDRSDKLLHLEVPASDELDFFSVKRVKMRSMMIALQTGWWHQQNTRTRLAPSS